MNKKTIIVFVIIFLLIGAFCGILLYRNSQKRSFSKTDTDATGKKGDENSIQSEEFPGEPPNGELPPDGEMREPPDGMPGMETEPQLENITTEKKIIEISDETFIGKEQDVTLLITEENSKTTIKNSKFDKTGDSSDLGVSDKSGLNSAIKVSQISELILENSEITTNGKGASGASAVGAKATLTLNNSTIVTKGDRSKGILSTKKGIIYADNLKIETSGYKSSAIATDMGGGKIEIKNSAVITDNIDSAGIYATGNVIADNLKIESKQAEGVCIDGSGIVTLTNTEILSHKKRGTILYYTGPSQKYMPTGSFSMINGELIVNDGPVFYVMNTIGEIELNNVEIEAKSGIFLLASVDQFGELGQEGAKVTSKGGEVKLKAINQKIEGDFVVDSESTLELNLSENSEIIGAINSENTGKQIDVVIESGCTWTLTGDSYINSLDIPDESQINLNGYKIYYKEDIN